MIASAAWLMMVSATWESRVSAIACTCCSRESRKRIRRFNDGEKLARVAPLLARAVTRSFAPTEGNVIVDTRGRQVDHHHPRLASPLEVRRVLERRGHDTGRQSEFGIVGHRQRLVIIFGTDDARYRAEDFFARSAHVIGRFGE